jgi:hypothetical protein
VRDTHITISLRRKHLVKHPLRLAFVLVGSVGLSLAAGLAMPATAFAAGSGYTPVGTPTTGGTASGLAGTVVTSTTIQPSGGTASGTVGTATITAKVPAGTFTDPVQLVLTDATSSAVTPTGGGKVAVTFGIGIYENGTKVTGSFPAITVTVSSSSITAGSTVYLVTSSGLQAVSGASVSNGSATFSITSDPTVEVTTPAAAAGTTGAIAGATSGQTGKPFRLEEGIAISLLAFGGLLMLGLRLRRRSA